MEELNEDTPLFVISVAAAMSNMHPQTLRQYDRMGLVQPSRTSGQSRRYTLRNIAQLRADGVTILGPASGDQAAVAIGSRARSIVATRSMTAGSAPMVRCVASTSTWRPVRWWAWWARAAPASR